MRQLSIVVAFFVCLSAWAIDDVTYFAIQRALNAQTNYDTITSVNAKTNKLHLLILDGTNTLTLQFNAISNILWTYTQSSSNTVWLFANGQTNAFDTTADVNAKLLLTTNGLYAQIVDGSNGVVSFVTSTFDTIASVNAKTNLLDTIVDVTAKDVVVSNGVVAHTVTIAGTANQVVSSVATAQALSGNPATTLSLPQNIDTAANVQFGQIGVNLPGKIAGSLWLESDNMFASPTNGMTLTNGTLATALAQNQYSPAIYWAAHQWSSGSGGSDVSSAFRSFVQSGPGTSPAGIDSTWKIQASRNGSAFVDILTATASSGAGGIVGNWTVGANSFLNFSGRCQISSPVDSDLKFQNAAGTAFNRLIFGPVANTWPTVYATTNATGASLIANGLIGGTNGVSSYRSNLVATTSITVGASPFNWTNTLNCNVFVFINGGTITDISINGGTVFTVAGNTTLPLQQNEYFSVTYSVAPTARFKPF